MKYDITHTCGHKATHNMYGKSTERERKIAWLKEQPCLACKRSQEATQALDQANQDGLPELTGTEKQIAWALKIRSEKLASLRDYRANMLKRAQAANVSDRALTEALDQFDACDNQIRQQAHAPWWIDRRDNTTQELLQEAYASLH
jgi:hypothetical protein